MCWSARASPGRSAPRARRTSCRSSPAFNGAVAGASERKSTKHRPLLCLRLFQPRKLDGADDDRIEQAGKAQVEIGAAQRDEAIGAAQLGASDTGLSEFCEVVAEIG